MPTKIAAISVTDYQAASLDRALAEALQILGGWERFIQPNNKVLIKPNLLEAVSPQKAATTHPAVLQAVIRAIKACGAMPCVGDSPAVHSTRAAADKAGILAVCAAENVQLLKFDCTVNFPCPQGLMIKSFSLAAELSQVDRVISLAKMKTHSFMGVTGTVKNLFGCFVGTDKAQFHLRMQKHADFAKMIVDLYSVVQPVLNIVDGVIGMEGTGPRNGDPIASKLLIAGANGFAVDLVMAKHMGFVAEQLPIAAAAIKAGVSPTMADIIVEGSGKAVYHQFKRPPNHSSLQQTWIPNWLLHLAQKQLTALPVIKGNCIACGRCAKHCPPQAIVIANNCAHINDVECIRCYCCQELCPVDAVTLRDGVLLRLVKLLHQRVSKK